MVSYSIGSAACESPFEVSAPALVGASMLVILRMFVSVRTRLFSYGLVEAAVRFALVEDVDAGGSPSGLYL